MNNSPETPENFASGVMKKAGRIPDTNKVWPQEDGNGSSPFYKPLIPAISLPKGGNVPAGIVEKCSVNTMDGTARLKLPLPLTLGRGGFTPALSLNYNHRGGNGVYGMGWELSLPAIRRKTNKQVPVYNDIEDTETFQLAGIGDLVPRLKSNGEEDAFFSENTVYFIKRYLARIEGVFSRIEYIKKQGSSEGWWRITTRDNITTWYGLNTEGCIADPGHRDHIWEWLPQLSTDHKGNIHLYRYIKENLDQVIESNEPQEKNRCNGTALFTNTYLKSVQYNNTIPWFVSKAQVYEPILPNAADFLMEAVWDYGDHSSEHKPMPDRQWPVRNDPFSVYRSGFEIRTYRKCRRILQFHHFNELNGHDLVYSLGFSYKADKAPGTTADTLVAVLMRGYTYNDKQEAWYHKDQPEVTFAYESQLLYNKETLRHTISREAPALLNLNPFYPRIAYGNMDDNTGWLYDNITVKNGKQIYTVDPRHIFAEDGAIYQSLSHDLRINWDSPLLLGLYGQVKLLVAGDRVWLLHEDGHKPYFTDREKGPLLLFRDKKQSIFLADMSGDGLADLVRIKEDGICYWPNIGHGLFGAMVQMKHFSTGSENSFYDLHRLALVDINGNGQADVIYLGKNSCTLFFNLGGNSWSSGNTVPLPAEAICYNELSVFDFKGNGGCCLVWNNKDEKTKPALILDLNEGRKPCRMYSYDDGMGKTVTFVYKSSTDYYREDKKREIAGATMLSVPLDCVAEAHFFDASDDSRRTETYTYRRGYFDYEEQMFRGFAYVETTVRHCICLAEQEQWEPYQLLTKNWFDPGSGAHRNLWMNAAREEQYFFPGWEEVLETSVEPGLKALEQKEAFRALAGLPVRQEVYKFKVGEQPHTPLSVMAEVYYVSCLQPLPVAQEEGSEGHSVSLVSRQQKLTFTHAQNSESPEVIQELLLGADEYGNTTKEAKVVYAWNPASGFCDGDMSGKQMQISAWVSEYNFTNDILEENLHYRLRLPYEIKSYELKDKYTGMLWTSSGLFDRLNGIGLPDADLNGKQLLAHHLIRFKNNRADNTPLDTGIIQSLAIPHACYQKVLSAGLEKQCKVSCVADMMLKDDHCSRPGDKCKYWASSEAAMYDQPLTNFFTPYSFVNAVNQELKLVYWKNYYLLPAAITDGKGDAVTVADYNWRNLQPLLINHHTEGLCHITYDALGVPVALTKHGKDGDRELKGMPPPPDLYDFADMEAGTYLFDHPQVYAPVLLGNAVWRSVYNLESSPATIAVISDTNNDSEKTTKDGSSIEITYFDARGIKMEFMHSCEKNSNPG